MKKRLGKLVLNRETLRQLDPVGLGEVVGGEPTRTEINCPTRQPLICKLTSLDNPSPGTGSPGGPQEPVDPSLVAYRRG